MLAKAIYKQNKLPGKCFAALLLTTFTLLTPALAQVDTAEPDPNAPKALQSRITAITGKHVQFTTDGQVWLDAELDIALGANASVRTGFASTCELDFGGHSILQIEPLSSVKIADYARINQIEQVRPNLQYGALRCGVEKGRIDADTKISTPVSTLSIRGTMVYVEYDPGTRHCQLRVDMHGPAFAQGFFYGLPPGSQNGQPGGYQLDEGTQTDESLRDNLELAIFDRVVFVTGTLAAGGITTSEAEFIAQNTAGSSVAPTGSGADPGDQDSTDGSSDGHGNGNGDCCPGPCCE